MSAYVVSTTHIDAIVTAMLECGAKGAAFRATCEDFVEERVRAARLGEILIRANVASVNHRYSESRPEVRASMTSDPEEYLPYRYRMTPWDSGGRVAPELRLVRALALVTCYEYQACEPDGWIGSPAWEECDRLKAWIGEKLRKLLGAGDLWGCDEDRRNVYVEAPVREVAR